MAYQAAFEFVTKRRNRRCAEIESFFLDSLHEEFYTDFLHSHFGVAFRSRLSELRRDPERRIDIHNKVERLPDGKERSVYWATLRPRHLDLG
jgi:hypothetical protein